MQSLQQRVCSRRLGAPRHHAGTALTPVRPLPHVARPLTQCCRASSSDKQLGATIANMLKRYDYVSTGMGALCVTGYFWSQGQPPLEALGITVVSTIIALVANEVLFAPSPPSK